MDNHQLRERLEHLRTELEHTPAVDARTRALLESVLQDVHAVLARSDPVPAQPAQSVGARLRAAVQHVEGSHPQLTWTLSQLSDTLSRMGL
jgi:Domain of unknown function (DUF4404)